MRAREAGIRIGPLEPGPLDAITDVAGVRVGHETLIAGDGPLVVGRGPVRTGVTVILPRQDHGWDAPVFAGCHTLNGAGEMTGLEWLRESGTLSGPIAITNTHSVGVGRTEAGGYTVGAVVQANYGRRERLRIDGVPVGEEIPTSEVPRPGGEHRPGARGYPGAAGIRLDHRGAGDGRAALAPPVHAPGAARGPGSSQDGRRRREHQRRHLPGVLNGNAGLPPEHGGAIPLRAGVEMLANVYLSELLAAAIEATEAAIVNALLAAETMVGRDGIVAHGLDQARLLAIMVRYGRLARPPS